MMAREILPDDVAVQIAPNLADVRELIPCGVNDLGGISPLTIDYVNPEHPWPQIDRLRATDRQPCPPGTALYLPAVHPGRLVPGTSQIPYQASGTTGTGTGWIAVKQRELDVCREGKDRVPDRHPRGTDRGVPGRYHRIRRGEERCARGQGSLQRPGLRAFFGYLETHGVRTHFIRMLDPLHDACPGARDDPARGDRPEYRRRFDGPELPHRGRDPLSTRRSSSSTTRTTPGTTRC